MKFENFDSSFCRTYLRDPQKIIMTPLLIVNPSITLKPQLSWAIYDPLENMEFPTHFQIQNRNFNSQPLIFDLITVGIDKTKFFFGCCVEASCSLAVTKPIQSFLIQRTHVFLEPSSNYSIKVPWSPLNGRSLLVSLRKNLSFAWFL